LQERLAKLFAYHRSLKCWCTFILKRSMGAINSVAPSLFLNIYYKIIGKSDIETQKNMEKNIELEFRAEISLKQFEKLLSNLRIEQKLIRHTKRLSVMFLGAINKTNFDIRVRISSNGESEVVVKKGNYHAHNRVECSQKIEKKQFIGMVKIVSLFGFKSKVSERENFVFDLGNNTSMVLVKAGPIAYVEIEKMSHKSNIRVNKINLLRIAESYGLKLIDNAGNFNELCDRLTRNCDWVFDGTSSHMEKLGMILKDY